MNWYKDNISFDIEEFEKYLNKYPEDMYNMALLFNFYYYTLDKFIEDCATGDAYTKLMSYSSSIKEIKKTNPKEYERMIGLFKKNEENTRTRKKD